MVSLILTALSVVSCNKQPISDSICAVDIGLSVKWADRNVGADSPSDYGNYYSWGEIDYKSEYSDETYIYSEDKVKLEDVDDVAHVLYGDNWRMPTLEEMMELCETLDNSNYKWEWKVKGGHNGCEVTYLVNGKSIFLPAAGWKCYMTQEDVGGIGYYWSASGDVYSTLHAWDMHCYFMHGSIKVGKGLGDRVCGLSVRPVCDYY